MEEAETQPEQPTYEVDKYQAAYLQQINDDGARVTREAKERLITAIREVAEDVGAPSEGYIYDGAKKAFIPTPEVPRIPQPVPAGEPEGGD